MSTQVEVPEAAPVSAPPVLSQEPAAVPSTVIRPAKGWQLINVRELWQFRELLCFLTWRDIKVRYKQTLLGAAWAVLQPAMMMVVFALFFGRRGGLSSGRLPYPLFVYAGLLPWTFFATAIANAGNSVVGSERLITKIYFPRLAIPLASVAAALVDFAIACSLLVVLMVWYGVQGLGAAPGAALLLVPLLVLTLALAAIGMGTLLAALNVAYRDFRYVIPFLVQVWMFATPAIYMDRSAERVGLVDRVLLINPINGLVASFRAAVLGGAVPWPELAASAAAAVLLFLAGCFYFRKVEDRFADII
jgi:lipopolysaccharide transport system permease protein